MKLFLPFRLMPTISVRRLRCILYHTKRKSDGKTPPIRASIHVTTLPRLRLLALPDSLEYFFLHFLYFRTHLAQDVLLELFEIAGACARASTS